MFYLNFTSRMLRPLMLVMLALTVLSHSGIAGGDTYEIYLNQKQILKQHVGQLSSGIITLQLDQDNYNDEIVVNYSHCGVPGKGRNIIVMNEKNQVLKEWKFSDAQGSDVSMKIAVKDLLNLKKNNPNATLKLCYFSAEQLPKGRTLASIQLTAKSVI